MQSQRRQPARFDQEASGRRIVRPVVPRRLVDERRLIGVACVEGDRRGVVIEMQVSVQAVGEFRQSLREVGVEVPGEDVVA